MKVGYARVSTKSQCMEMQIDELKKAGCDRIYEEVASGAKSNRPVLDRVVGELQPQDTLVVWKLDRLGRTLPHLVKLVNDLSKNNIHFESLNDSINTTTSQGRFTFHLFSSLAEFERELIRERTQAGLSSARKRGRLGGRPKGLTPEAESTACAAETLYKERKLSVQQIASQLQISKATLYAYLKHRNVTIGPYNQKSA